MKRRHFKYQVFVTALFMALGLQAQERPVNIILMLADDLGYGDVKWTNPKAFIDTPNLNQLAEEGVVLKACYSSSAMCSPSRAGLLTGKNPLRTGVHDWIKEIYKAPLSNVHLRSEEVTIAERLKGVGYQTAIIGKWHVNNEFNTGYGSDPNEQGFDYSFATPVHARPSNKNPFNFYENGEAVGVIGTQQDPQFSAQIVAEKAMNWIAQRDTDKPFFLYLPFHEAHVVCDAPDTTLAKYQARIKSGVIPHHKGSGTDGLGQAEYYGCVENMDYAVGRLVAYLEREGLLENTIIVFSSDNGPDTNRRHQGRLQSVGSSGVFKGRKRWLFEGGIHQASFVYWKGELDELEDIETPVSQLDLVATFCDIAGAKAPKKSETEGVSWLPLFEGQSIKRPYPLTWHFYAPRGDSPQSVIREGDWVLTANWEGKRHQGRFDLNLIPLIQKTPLQDFKLYNLRQDPGQTQDLYTSEPKIAKALQKQLIKEHERLQKMVPDADAFLWTPELEQIARERFGKVEGK